MNKYVIVGTGKGGREALNYLGKERIVCFCENKHHNVSDHIDGLPVLAIDSIEGRVREVDQYEFVITSTVLKSAVDLSVQLSQKGYKVRLLEDIVREEILSKEAEEYNQINTRNSFQHHEEDAFFIMRDRYKEAGSISSYFWQDLWAAKLIINGGLPEHFDIGSRIDGFIAHLLSAGVRVKLIDIRPLEMEISGLDFTMADATNLEGIEDNSIESLSALCSLEHFGLGRYGDRIDPEACFKCFDAIQRVMAPEGKLYLSLPLGRDHVEFNAHRVLSAKTVIKCLSRMELIEFSSCYKEEYENDIKDYYKYDTWDKHGGDRFGLYLFQKKQ